MKIFIDLETAPEGDINEIEVKAPANYKKPEAIQKYQDEHRDEEYRKRALKGITGQIVSIAWSFGADIDSESRTMDQPEGALLDAFFTEVGIYQANADPREASTVQWIGHNLIDFDLRYLKQRCWVNGIKPTVMIPADARHGDYAFDTMREWGGSYGSDRYVSQDALYKALGGPPLEGDDMDGSMVYDLWVRGDIEAIAAYNERDVQKLMFNYRRLTWAS